MSTQPPPGPGGRLRARAATPSSSHPRETARRPPTPDPRQPAPPPACCAPGAPRGAASRTGHADALELPDLVQAGGVVLTRARHALVDVDLAARAGVALQAAALEGAQRVDAPALVLTGVGACGGVRRGRVHGEGLLPAPWPLEHVGTCPPAHQTRSHREARRLPAGDPSEGRGHPHQRPQRALSPAGHVPSEHSSTSWLQAGPVYPEGQVQMALPLTGLVSQLEPSLQGLLMQASLRWQSRPGRGPQSAGPCPSPPGTGRPPTAGSTRTHTSQGAACHRESLLSDPEDRPAGPAAGAPAPVFTPERPLPGCS